MARPSVSFIIPVLNAENFIARCLISIRNLVFPQGEYEVLIIDNGSSDRTHQIVRDLGFEVHVVPNLNVGALRNRGATMAQGGYLAFVDSDIELTAHWLQRGLAVFEDPRVIAAGCPPRAPKGGTWIQETWELQRRRQKLVSKPIPVSWLSSMNLIARREDFIAVSGFNVHLETAEDVDLCYRLGRRGLILCNPSMEAVHWGEARDLRHFWRKEVWRGLGSLKGVLSHGFRWDELPSLGYPFYIICLVLILAMSVFIDLWSRRMLLAPLCLILLVLPALLLALRTAGSARRPKSVLKLFILYFIYGFARAHAMVKASTTSRV